MSTSSSKPFGRRSIRLKGYDYTSKGAYFITLVTQNRRPVFGRLEDGRVYLSEWGEVVWEEWYKTLDFRKNIIEGGAFIVMPDHVHMVINIKYEDTLDFNRNKALGIHISSQKNKESFGKPIAGSIPTIVGSFKFAVTYQINKKMGAHGQKIWQRNY